MLLHRLDGGEVVIMHSDALQGFDVFTAVDGCGALGVVADVVIGLPECLREFIHHHPAIFSIGNLANQ